MNHASQRSSSELNILVLQKQVTQGKYIRYWLRGEMESFLKKATSFYDFKQFLKINDIKFL